MHLLDNIIIRTIANLFLMVFVLLASVLIGTFLIEEVYLLPTYDMIEHVSQTIEDLEEETDSYYWINNDITSKSDNYTDSVMLNTAIYDESEDLTEKSMMNYHYEYENCGQVENLSFALSKEQGYETYNYSRYWHGYLIFLKPLLLFFNYFQIRWIIAVASCILLGFVFCGFYKAFYTHKYSIAFLASVIFLNPVVMRASMQYSCVLFIVLVEYIVALYAGKFLNRHKKFYLLFLLSGITTAYFDLLSYPIATLGMLLVLQALLFDTSLPKGLLRTLWSTFVWILGYASMWVGKWVMATYLTGQDCITPSIENAFFRAGTEVTVGDEAFSWDGLFIKNFLWFTDENALLFKMLCFVVLACLFIVGYTRRARVCFCARLNILLIIIGLIPLARYALLPNHSFVHYWFTYREGMVYVMAAFSLVFSNLIFIDKKYLHIKSPPSSVLASQATETQLPTHENQKYEHVR